ncbi:LPXTG cell wall anchor domain-containing protein [Jeotgalicoccus psychrophilus]|uniref:LPXTG cell wall anchor domain-containing protein n=1 Tax=Jeotgalicoccus psychrophilus TaxID=157228 RepID=UPI00040FB20F|nr:LPXTG cell wall anchor domain-containing protein [Jeotgalicoccus psychrophilus]
MNNDSFKTFKKASLASALGVFAFTYAGGTEANDDAVENQSVEAENIETIETQQVENTELELPIDDEAIEFQEETDATESEVENTVKTNPASTEEIVEEYIEPELPVDLELTEENLESNNTSKVQDVEDEQTKEAQGISTFSQEITGDIDVEAPELISVTTDKSTYNAGEQIEMTVVAEDETNVDYIFAAFTNNSEDGPQQLSASGYEIIPLGNNRYESTFYIDVPERTPSTSFRLSGLGLYDENYENYLSDWYGEELLDLTVNIENNNTITDIDAPELISVTTDKSTYNAGEQIEMTVVAEDETNVDYIFAAFTNNSEDGPQQLSASGYEIIPLGNNRYKSTFYIDVPERTPSTSFRLSGLGLYDENYENYLSDWYGDELLDLTINVGEGIQTPGEDENTNELPEEQIINDDLSENYINHLTIYDTVTGNRLTSVSFVGNTFIDRLDNLLLSINNEYNSEYVVADQVLIDSQTSGFQINDYYSYFTTDTYDIYVNNTSNSVGNYPFENRPFLPEHQLYDDYYLNNGELMQINIIDSEGYYLYEGESFGSYTIDELIRTAMMDIDSELYYYDSAYVSNGFMWRDDYIGDYASINVYVADREDGSIDTSLPEEPELPITDESPEMPVEEVPSDQNENSNEEIITGEPIEEVEQEQSAPESSNGDSNNITDPEDPAKEEEEKVITPPLVNPIKPDDDIITGQGDSNSEIVITLPDEEEIITESDTEGLWEVELPKDTVIQTDDVIVVSVKDINNEQQTETTVQGKEKSVNSEESQTVSEQEASTSESDKEELPDTGLAAAETGLIATAFALAGAAFLFVTGRRKRKN